MNRVLVPQELAPLSIPSPAANAVVREMRGATMGTTWCVKVVAPASTCLDSLQEEIQAELDRVVSEMSTWEAATPLRRFNDSPANTWTTFPEALYQVVEYALAVASETNGAYDPSAGPLVNLWGFGPDAPISAPPDMKAIDRARARCGWTRGRLDPVSRRAWQPGGWYLDLSAIAKGFAVDQVAVHLRARGIESWLVEVGGELKGFGVKPDYQPWWVALEHPASDAAAGETAIVALHGLAVASSGDYRRFFEHNGTRYSHTIDPRTGWPVASGTASVSVIHPSCMAADALSTALTVLGSREGLAYATRAGIAALFIDRADTGFTEIMTPALAAMLDG